MLETNEKCSRCKQVNNYFRKNVATDKKYIPRKRSLKFQNSKSEISCKIEFCMFFKWENKTVCLNFLKN